MAIDERRGGEVLAVIAAELYGDDAPTRGYIYGASGGAYQTIGAAENTDGVWDGAVPMVPGVPKVIPSFQGVQVLALRCCRTSGPRSPTRASNLAEAATRTQHSNDNERSILEEDQSWGILYAAGGNGRPS